MHIRLLFLGIFLLAPIGLWSQVQSDSKATLLVVGCDLKCQNQSIFQLEFNQGGIVSTAVVAEIPMSESDFLSGQPVLWNDRFIISGDGGVFDLRERQLFSAHKGIRVGTTNDKVIIHQYTIGRGDAPLPASRRELEKMVTSATGKAVSANTVILTTGKESHEVYEFDLSTRTYSAIKKPNLYSAGVQALSPDLTKGVEYNLLSSSLVLLKRGKNASGVSRGTLNGTYRASCGSNCAGMGQTPPILWIDNERFLTQRRNGEVVLYDTANNKRLAFDRVSVPEELGQMPLLTKGAGGSFYYVVDKIYHVDIEGKILREVIHIPLGHGFSRSDAGSPTEFSFKDKKIGSFLSFRSLATDGYLAVEEHPSERTRFPTAIRVWDAITESWIEVVVGPRPRIVGWLSN